MAQVLANVVASILFLSIYYIVNRLSQKRSFGIKDEKIIRFFSMSLERANFFFGQYLQYYLYWMYLKL